MKLLAIDTVTEMCSVALNCHGQYYTKQEYVPQQHTRLVLPMIEQVLQEADIGSSQLDAVSFSRGPGSFTGLRICASLAQGLALAHDLPVIPLSSLAILAQGAWQHDKAESIIACIDARKNEIYWACYTVVAGLVVLEGEEVVSAPVQMVLPKDRQWHGVGTGFASYADELKPETRVGLATMIGERYPLASDMLPLAEKAWNEKHYVDASEAIPVYLRDNVVSVNHA